MFKHLLIAIDGSAQSDKALEAGLQLARAHEARVTIMTATDPVTASIGAGGFGTFDAGPVIDQLEAAYASEAAGRLDAANARALATGVTAQTRHVPRSRPADAIVGLVQDAGCDTIVMGSHGRRGIERLLLGSQAAEVLALSPVPVLIVK